MRLRVLLALMIWVHPAAAAERSALQVLVAMTVGDRGTFIDGGKAHFFSRTSRVKDRVVDFERTERSVNNCVYDVVGHYRTSYTDKPSVTDVTFTAVIDYSSLYAFERMDGHPDTIRLKGGNRMSCVVRTIDGAVQPEACLDVSVIDGINDFSRWEADYDFFREKVCKGRAP